MTGNITFTMIKPEAVRRGHMGKIICMITDNGFNIRALKYIQITKEQAAAFYLIHRDRPFYDELIEFMSSGPIIAAIIEKDNAVEEFRKLIGSTNPEDAKPGTIRRLCGISIQANAIHGSDSDENAIKEGNFFFSNTERF
ncbi:MAG: nucleoside-diphosphate kinase [Bacteroidales bacterium]|nr:nucleoside-diphosphate kinase [Bacteroidales bacterium]